MHRSDMRAGEPDHKMISDQRNLDRTLLLDAHWHRKILNDANTAVRNHFLTAYGPCFPHSKGKF